MAHLTRIGIENFKLFHQQLDFELKPITLLTGTNSSGKTSVIQALRLLTVYLGNKEIYRQGGPGNVQAIEQLSLEHIGERLGDFNKLVHNQSNDRFIAFTMPTLLKGVVDTISLRLKISQSSGRLNEGVLTGLSFFSENVQREIVVVERERDTWSVCIAYDYFWQEFKREAMQQRAFATLHEKREAIRANKAYDLQEGNLKNTEEEVLEGIEEQMRQSHPQYYHYVTAPEQGSKEEVLGYAPFFGAYPIPFLNLRLLDSKDKADQKSSTLEQIDEEELLKELDELAKHKEVLQFLQKQNSYLRGGLQGYDKMWQDMQDELLQNFCFSYAPGKERQQLREVLHLIGHPLTVLNAPSGSITWHLDGFLSDYIRTGGNVMEYYEYNDNELEEYINGPSTAKQFFEQFVGENILYALQFSSNYFSQVGYLSSIRNIVKRAYGNRREETEFTELILEFLKYNIETEEVIVAFINKYIGEFGIGDSISIERDREGINNRFYILREGQKTLLADLGYGISQFMPILLKIAISAYNHQDKDKKNFAPSTICIEEPETNLHPALQSRLADLFVAAKERFNIQFIVETHSEYLTRKLQFLVGSKTLAADEVLVYYFGAGMEGLSSSGVKRIELKDDGSLSDDFGPGFFDEAMRLKFDLLLLSNTQKN